MESRIKVAVDFENGNQPVIHIAKKRSEDVRDELLQSFLERFKATSRWAKVVYVGTEDADNRLDHTNHYHIVPISVGQIEEEMNLMAAYLKELNIQQQKNKI